MPDSSLESCIGVLYVFLEEQLFYLVVPLSCGIPIGDNQIVLAVQFDGTSMF